MSAIDNSTTIPALVGRLHDAPMRSVAPLVSSLSEGYRASLAIFCYSRAHLHEVGLAIAATCTMEALVLAGGKPGTFLFERSRHPHYGEHAFLGARRMRISLATNASRQKFAQDLRPAIT
jgi:hypothetical protein